MTAEEVAAALEGIADKRILVIGDVMLDEYIYGAADRISAEAPVPIVRHDSRETRLGGAGNAALNLVALGASVTFCAVVGTDDEGVELLSGQRPRQLRDWWLVQEKHRPTTVKTRIVSHGQQMLRIDRETTEPIAAETEKKLLDMVTAAMKWATVVLVADYAKGVYTEAVADHVQHLTEEKEVPLIIDPKPVNWHLYEGATALTPNRAELMELARLWSVGTVDEYTEVTTAATHLRHALDADAILATLGKHGVMLDYTTESGGEAEAWLPALCEAPVDVTGAGDTVSAAFAACMAAHLSAEQAAEIGNLAGSVVVQKYGCAVATPDEIVHAAKKNLTSRQAA